MFHKQILVKRKTAHEMMTGKRSTKAESLLVRKRAIATGIVMRNQGSQKMALRNIDQKTMMQTRSAQKTRLRRRSASLTATDLTMVNGKKKTAMTRARNQSIANTALKTTMKIASADIAGTRLTMVPLEKAMEMMAKTRVVIRKRRRMTAKNTGMSTALISYLIGK